MSPDHRRMVWQLHPGLLIQSHHILGDAVIQQQIGPMVCGLFCGGDYQEIGV